MKSCDIVQQLTYMSRDKMMSTSGIYLYGNWESDFIYVTKAGYIFEVEVKVDRWDFVRDRELKRQKHKALKNGSLGLRGFYYALPEDVIDDDEVPFYAGLLISDGKKITPVKKAPFLKDPAKMTPVQEFKIKASISYQYLQKWKGKKL